MFNILLPQHLIFHAPPNSAQDELVGAVKIEEYLWLLTHPGENSKRGISIFRLGQFEQIGKKVPNGADVDIRFKADYDNFHPEPSSMHS